MCLADKQVALMREIEGERERSCVCVCVCYSGFFFLTNSITIVEDTVTCFFFLIQMHSVAVLKGELARSNHRISKTDSISV